MNVAALALVATTTLAPCQATLQEYRGRAVRWADAMDRARTGYELCQGELAACRLELDVHRPIVVKPIPVPEVDPLPWVVAGISTAAAVAAVVAWAAK